MSLINILEHLTFWLILSLIANLKDKSGHQLCCIDFKRPPCLVNIIKSAGRILNDPFYLIKITDKTSHSEIPPSLWLTCTVCVIRALQCRDEWIKQMSWSEAILMIFDFHLCPVITGLLYYFHIKSNEEG